MRHLAEKRFKFPKFSAQSAFDGRIMGRSYLPTLMLHLANYFRA